MPEENVIVKAASAMFKGGREMPIEQITESGFPL
jgi:hypothetical protein